MSTLVLRVDSKESMRTVPSCQRRVKRGLLSSAYLLMLKVGDAGLVLG
jgi:hypothetical protein